MESNEKQYVYELLKTKNYKQLYQTQAQVINEMLLIDSQEDFEDFLREKLTDNVFDVIKNNIQQIYVDLGTRDNLEERIGVLNRQLKKNEYSIRLDYDETYCAGVYFLSVDCL